MHSTVRVAIDDTGRLLLPKAVREAAGLRPGSPLEVTASQGHIELKRIDSEVRLIRQGRLTVAVAEDDLPPMADGEIEIWEPEEPANTGGRGRSRGKVV